MPVLRKIAYLVVLSNLAIIFMLAVSLLPKSHFIAFAGKKSVFRKVTHTKIVALTFDDGPDPRYTLPILDILKEYQAPATFFMVGNNINKYPDIAKKVVAEGHEVGNHTMDHRPLTDLTPPEVYHEIEDCYKTIRTVTGVVPKYFRSPKGLTTPDVEAVTNTFEMSEILWTLTIENKKAPTPEAMVERVINKIEPGSIILLHDGRLDRTNTVKALPLLIKELRNNGYRIVPLSELLLTNDSLDFEPIQLYI